MRPTSTRTRILCFGALLALLSTSCVSMTGVMKSWTGHQEAEVLSVWGAPELTASLPNGGRVLTWSTIWNQGANIYTCRKSLTVDARGTIVSWSYSGCPRYVRK